MASMSATAEKLRSKHIRTLEALNKLVEENKRLKKQLETNNNNTQENNNPTSPESLESVQIERLQFENSRLASQLNDVNETLLELRRSHAKSEQQFHDNKINFLRQINDLKTLLSQAEEKSKEYRHTIVDLEGQLEQQGTNRRAQLLSSVEDLRNAENELEEHKRLVFTLEEKIKKLESLQNENGDVDKIINEMNLYKSKYMDMVKKDKVKSSQIVEMETKIKKLSEALQHYSDKESVNSATLNDQIKLMKVELQERKKNETKLQNDLSLKESNEARLKATIVKLEQKIEELTNKIKELLQQINVYKKKYDDDKHKTGENEESLGNKFAPFIKLKRENAILKAQLKDLMLTQKKMLGSAKRVNMSHGRGR